MQNGFIVDMQMKRILIAFVFSLSFNSAYAGLNDTVQCPQNISVTQSISQKYPGWQSSTTEPNYYLSNVTFYSGKPEEKASLVPDSSKKHESKWTFSPNEQIYLTCEYNQTNIQLTQALPSQITRCTVSYDANVRSSSGGFLPKLIQCTSNK